MIKIPVFLNRILRFVVPVILFGITIYMVASTFIYKSGFTCKQVFAIALLFVNIAVYFFNAKWGSLALLFLLLLGFFDAIHFFYENRSVSYFLKGPSVKISTPSVNFRFIPLLLLHLVLNWKEMEQIWKRLLQY